MSTVKVKKEKSVDKDLKDVLSDFPVIEEDNPVSKVVGMLFSDDNIEKKTELDKPLKWSALKIIEDKLTAIGLPKSALVLAQFRETSFKYLVSYKRKGIKELIEVLNALTQYQKEEESKELATQPLGR